MSGSHQGSGEVEPSGDAPWSPLSMIDSQVGTRRGPPYDTPPPGPGGSDSQGRRRRPPATVPPAPPSPPGGATFAPPPRRLTSRPLGHLLRAAAAGGVKGPRQYGGPRRVPTWLCTTRPAECNVWKGERGRAVCRRPTRGRAWRNLLRFLPLWRVCTLPCALGGQRGGGSAAGPGIPYST